MEEKKKKKTTKNEIATDDKYCKQAQIVFRENEKTKEEIIEFFEKSGTKTVDELAKFLNSDKKYTMHLLVHLELIKSFELRLF